MIDTSPKALARYRKRCVQQRDVRGDIVLALIDALDEARAALERERLRLVACGVVANANTRDSAAELRKMHPDFWSASCGDVERAVDREMDLRDVLEKASL